MPVTLPRLAHMWWRSGWALWVWRLFWVRVPSTAPCWRCLHPTAPLSRVTLRCMCVQEPGQELEGPRRLTTSCSGSVWLGG